MGQFVTNKQKIHFFMLGLTKMSKMILFVFLLLQTNFMQHPQKCYELISVSVLVRKRSKPYSNVYFL